MKLEELDLRFWEQKNSFSTCSSLSNSICSVNVISLKQGLKSLAPKLKSFNYVASPQCNKVHVSTKPKSTAHFQAAVSQEEHDGTQQRSRLGGWKCCTKVVYALRTRNIEKIAAELRKYGRIEGKNVFYWFQNHKARERQRQKRSPLLALGCTSSLMSFAPAATKGEKRMEGPEARCKRQCRSWAALSLDSEEKYNDETVELFPLHPEGGKWCK